VILVDSNIPMYVLGSPHTHKTDAQQILERLIAHDERLVTDVEVLPEIMHRYVAIRRPDAIQPAFDMLLAVVDEVLAIELVHAQRAKEIVLGASCLSARDAMHLAVMEHHQIARVLSFDRRFDGFPGVTRVGS
jgi:uncharacterized protein